MAQASRLPAIEQALRRLANAVDGLDAAAARRRQSERGAESLKSEMHLMASDRAKLAEALDAAREQGASLEHASREVARRLDAAMDTLRGAIRAEQG